MKDFEDPYRIEVFKIVLPHLLNYPAEKSSKRGASTKVTASNKAKAGKPREKTALRADVMEKLMKIEHERFNKMSHLKGRNRYLLLLGVAKDKGIDGLSSVELEYILKQRFVLKGIQETNIRRDLRNSTGLVEKAPPGKGHAFKIRKEGEEYISKELDKLAGRETDARTTPSH